MSIIGFSCINDYQVVEENYKISNCSYLLLVYSNYNLKIIKKKLNFYRDLLVFKMEQSSYQIQPRYCKRCLRKLTMEFSEFHAFDSVYCSEWCFNMNYLIEKCENLIKAKKKLNQHTDILEF